MSEVPEGTFFDKIGGHATFQKLVAKFYRRVAQDPILMPMYPAKDLEIGRASCRERV